MKAMAGVDMRPDLATVVSAADGVTRCRWATETGRDLTAYHDQEWGTPTYNEAMLFEALVLTYFENGLSWVTVFDKRDNLRAAFHRFDPVAVAAMTPDDVERLMVDASIIRNRQKIEATLHNARLLSK
ncbi:DNA-3-methyladenine glycosylase 1 [Mycobacterium marinum]|nr:DNA-3-methyladenine glycosylase 1 [Mycobacterium marinum]RFZ12499.1 DNA-3-methyladenine glycosylase 1 [Mycobacterium marinum]